MRPHDVAHDRQAEAAAVSDRLGRHPRIEQAIDDLGRNSRTGVGDLDANRRPDCAVAAIESVPPPGIASSALVTRLNSAISNCVASALTGGRPSATDASQPNVVTRQPRLRHLTHARDDVREVHDLHFRRLPRVVEHRPQHARDVLNLLVDGPQLRTRPIVRPRVVADHLNVARDEVQRRARLVDDVRGDLAQRRNALGAPQRFSQREQLALAGSQLRHSAATGRASLPRCGPAATG